jgi:hypothetical protein
LNHSAKSYCVEKTPSTAIACIASVSLKQITLFFFFNQLSIFSECLRSVNWYKKDHSKPEEWKPVEDIFGIELDQKVSEFSIAR